jgi:hypothetical protein
MEHARAEHFPESSRAWHLKASENRLWIASACRAVIPTFIFQRYRNSLSVIFAFIAHSVTLAGDVEKSMLVAWFSVPPADSL